MKRGFVRHVSWPILTELIEPMMSDLRRHHPHPGTAPGLTAYAREIVNRLEVSTDHEPVIHEVRIPLDRLVDQSGWPMEEMVQKWKQAWTAALKAEAAFEKDRKGIRYRLEIRKLQGEPDGYFSVIKRPITIKETT